MLFLNKKDASLKYKKHTKTIDFISNVFSMLCLNKLILHLYILFNFIVVI